MQETKPTKLVVLLLAATVLIQSFSFLSLKYSSLQTGRWALILLSLAFVFMGLRAVLWQKVLYYSDLSLVYPFTSLVQILILIYAVVLFHESITIGHVFGLAMMLIGAYIIARD